MKRIHSSDHHMINFYLFYNFIHPNYCLIRPCPRGQIFKGFFLSSIVYFIIFPRFSLNFLQISKSASSFYFSKFQRYQDLWRIPRNSISTFKSSYYILFRETLTSLLSSFKQLLLNCSLSSNYVLPNCILSSNQVLLNCS